MDVSKHRIETSSEVQPQKKHRKRVPISCLNCKKRKVKCDKVKPACGGCVKNQVAHLCHYVEPVWATSDKDEGRGLAARDESHEEYEKVIYNQRKEIEELKHQLAVIQEFAPKIPLEKITHKREVNRAITVLHKLNPNVSELREQAEVNNDYFYSFNRVKTAMAVEKHVHVYSWLNTIKIDPQLTNLWFKITNIQKVYHMYKMSLIRNNKKETPPPKIHEVDFTTPRAYLEPQKCPVVECDFNLMVDDQATTRVTTPKSSGDEKDQLIQRTMYNIYSDSATLMLRRLQAICESLTTCLRGSSKLSMNQVQYLFDRYFLMSSYATENAGLFHFFRSEIWSNVRPTPELLFDLSVGNAPGQTDEDKFAFLKMKGVYLSMLALIVEESLDIVKVRHAKGERGDECPAFVQLFPEELELVGLGYKENNILAVVQEFIVSVCESKFKDEHLDHSLALVSLCLAWLNRLVILYRREGISHETQPGFGVVFRFFLSLVNSDNENGVRIWKDPSLVQFHGPDDRKHQLRMHLCHAWCDTIRMVNLMCFEFVLLVKPDDSLVSHMLRLYAKIEEAETDMSHVRYLVQCSEDLDSLKVALHVNYLVARCIVVISSGIHQMGGITLTLFNLQKVIEESESWSHTQALSKLKFTRFFESKSMLQYLDFYMTYICLLQSEECQDPQIIATSVPQMFSKCIELNLLLQKFIVFDIRNAYTQYILLAATEILGRLVQLIVGLLIRFRADPNSSYMIYTNGKSTVRIETSIRDDLITITSTTIARFTDSALMDKRRATKLLKLWKFYLTFIHNPNKLNAIGNSKVPHDLSQFSKTHYLEGTPKCPIDHTKGTFNDTSPMPIKQESNCPVDHTAFQKVKPEATKCPYDPAAAPAEESKRRCPFDHGSMGETPKPFVESHVRGSSTKITPTPPPIERPYVPKPPAIAPSMAPETLYEPINDIHLSELPNLDFDFLQNEAWFEQLGQGDLSNPPMEGFFQ